MKEDSYTQELFEQGNKLIASVQSTQGNDAHTIYFTGVILNLHKQLKENLNQEPILTCIKQKRSIQYQIQLKRS